MFLLNLLARLIGILHSSSAPRHLAAGFALGAILGLTPLMSLHNLVVVALILLLDVSISSALFALAIFGAVAFLLDPLFHRLGYFLLTQVELLRPFWTYLYNAPIAPLTRFYNTVVLGSLTGSLLAFVPIYLGFKTLVVHYRLHLAKKVEQWQVMKLIKANTIYGWYTRIRSLGV